MQTLKKVMLNLFGVCSIFICAAHASATVVASTSNDQQTTSVEDVYVIDEISFYNTSEISQQIKTSSGSKEIPTISSTSMNAYNSLLGSFDIPFLNASGVSAEANFDGTKDVEVVTNDVYLISVSGKTYTALPGMTCTVTRTLNTSQTVTGTFTAVDDASGSQAVGNYTAQTFVGPVVVTASSGCH